MKTGKRIVSIFLVALMLLTAAPLASFVGLEVAPKAKALEETGQCGDNVTWSFNSSTGALTISGTGAMTDYSYGGSPFYNSSEIKSVTINSGVTSIGDSEFLYCTVLTSVTIPDSVTSIGEWAFYGCTSLMSVTIPNSVTSIGNYAFGHCFALTSVTIPDSVTSIGSYAFSWCGSLTSVTILDSVTSIGAAAFNNCTSLTSVTIGNSVTSIGKTAFWYCTSLKDVYYTGSQEQWQNISIGSYNEPLINATIHYNNTPVPTKSHTVTYNYSFNGGTSATKTTATVAEGAAIDLTPTATKNGWTFVGWNTDPNAATALTSLVMGNNDITLYAIFKKNDQPPSGDENIIEISGTLTALTSIGYVAIDEVWYPYDTSNEHLSNLLNSWQIGTTIYCRLKSGVIIDCANWKVDHKLVSSVSVIGGKDVEFQAETHSYDRNELELSINVTNRLTDQNGISVFDANVIGYDLTFDKIVVSVPDTNLVYFKGGLFGLEKDASHQVSLSNPLTLPAAQFCHFSNASKGWDSYIDFIDEGLVLYVNNSQEWGATEKSKQVELTVDVFNGSDLVSTGKTTVVFHNPAAMARAAENTEIDKKAKDAAKLIDKTTGTFSHEFLSEIFTSDDLKYIEAAIKCKIALAALSESAYKKVDINDRIINKLIDYAGVKRSWIGFLNDAEIKLEVEANTEKYGMLKIDFLVPVTFASIGDGNPYAGWSFESSYTVSGGAGKKNVPAQKRSGDITSLFTFADIQTFSDSVQSVALAELESAYNIGYGDDFNKMCEMIFGDTITKILSKTDYKNYKHLLWKMMIYPSTHVDIYCPVDVYVFNAENEQCAAIEDNVVIQECEDIGIKINGDEKHITLYQRGYSIQVVPTADYHMRITIDEYNAPDSLVRSVNFDDIVIAPGNLFEADFAENNIDASYSLTKDNKDTVVPSTDVIKMHTPQIVEVVDYEATCLNDGLKHTECLTCSEIIESVVIPATGEHADADNDGYCDTCEEMMQGGQHCKYCGKIHGGLFGWLVKIFHSIFAIFKR